MRILERTTNVGIVPTSMGRREINEESNYEYERLGTGAYYLEGQNAYLSVEDIYVNKEEFRQAWNDYIDRLREYVSENGID